MKPTLIIGNATIYQGNNLEVLPTLEDNSVDSIVCDPPYELGFMGKSWDSSGIAYSVELWKECLRVLKPGGHLLAFGGTRTWHRLAVAIEDAGFEIRDNIAWLYGSGFPKSMNIAKAIDKANKFDGEVIGTETIDIGMQGGSMHAGRSTELVEREIKSLSPEAKTWDGWGTALKPAHEPIVVARKPVEGTVANNVLTYGVGALNIDGTRIPAEEGTNFTRPVNFTGQHEGYTRPWQQTDEGQEKNAESRKESAQKATELGRWPANIILDEFTAELLDEQSGNVRLTEGGQSIGKFNFAPAENTNGNKRIQGKVTLGGASRFFYVAKANKRDRNEGLENIEGKEIGAKGNGLARTCNTCSATVLDGCDCPDRTFSNPVRQNFHPTVKPTALMQYLIRLVTPEGGTVLDPFTGSGSTGKAALLENKKFIGIELTAEYLPIIEGRLQHALETQTAQVVDEGDLFE